MSRLSHPLAWGALCTLFLGASCNLYKTSLEDVEELDQGEYSMADAGADLGQHRDADRPDSHQPDAGNMPTDAGCSGASCEDTSSCEGCEADAVEQRVSTCGQDGTLYERRACEGGCTWSAWQPTSVCLEAPCVTASEENINQALEAAQRGTFEIVWEVTPRSEDLDAAIGTSSGANTGGIGFATSTRFGSSKLIDARDGDRYAAETNIPYEIGQTYRVRQVIDVATRTYDAHVQVGDQPEQLLAEDYAFRAEFSQATLIDHWIAGANRGDLSACLVSIESMGGPAVETLVLDKLKAFPTAYGGGASSKGGRGGVVVLVNTLDYDAPLVKVEAQGSVEEHWVGGIKAAIESDDIGARYILFDVSGTIDADLPVTYDRDDPRYESRYGQGIFRKQPNLGFITLYGQSAPEGGVTLHHSWIQMIRQQEIILRHLRVRTHLLRGSGYPIGDDTVTTPINIGHKNVIVDHCTASHGGDKGLILSEWREGFPMLDMTGQWNMVLDSATSMFSVDGVDGGPGDWDTADNISWFYNLSMSSHRTPNTGGGHEQLNFDVQNNVIQGIGSRLGNVVHGSPRVNIINNYYDIISSKLIQNKAQTTRTALIHASGNFYQNNDGVVLQGMSGEDNRVIFGDFSTSEALPSSMFTDTNMWGEVHDPAPVFTAQEARQRVLAEAGANRFVRDDGTRVTYRDSYDQNAVTRYDNREPYTKDWSGFTAPQLPESVRPSDYYVSVIGIPEWFVIQHGISDKDEVIDTWDFGAYRVQNDAGYPAIEIYAAWVAGDFEALLAQQ